MIDNTLSDPLDRVRFAIGDTAGEIISDGTLTALLAINNDNVNKTIIQALVAVVAECAKYMDEEVGDTKVWWSQQYAHYKDLLDKLTKDPAYLLAPVSHVFGGTSKKQVEYVNGHYDSRGPGIRQGEYTSAGFPKFDPSNPFFLDD